MSNQTASLGWNGDPNELKVRIQQALQSSLSETYDCLRVWSAWSYGTMAEDDFRPVLDRNDELVDELFGAITDNAAAIRAASIGAGDDGWRSIDSAPKDGTTFWAAKIYPNRRFRPDYFECSYSQTSYLGSLIDGRDSDTKGRWHNRSANKWDDPSHWRPLPPAPAATDPEGE